MWSTKNANRHISCNWYKCYYNNHVLRIQAIFYTLIGVVIGALLFILVVVPLEARYPFSFPLGDVLLSVNPGLFLRNIEILMLVSVVSAAFASLALSTRKDCRRHLGQLRINRDLKTTLYVVN